MPSQAFGFTGLAVHVGMHNSVLIHKQNIRLFERILSVKEALRQIGNAYRVTQAFGNAHYDRFAVNVFNAICSGVFADYIVENRKLEYIGSFKNSSTLAILICVYASSFALKS